MQCNIAQFSYFSMPGPLKGSWRLSSPNGPIPSWLTKGMVCAVSSLLIQTATSCSSAGRDRLDGTDRGAAFECHDPPPGPAATDCRSVGRIRRADGVLLGDCAVLALSPGSENFPQRLSHGLPLLAVDSDRHQGGHTDCNCDRSVAAGRALRVALPDTHAGTWNPVHPAG